jgi:hypothetical protein
MVKSKRVFYDPPETPTAAKLAHAGFLAIAVLLRGDWAAEPGVIDTKKPG